MACLPPWTQSNWDAKTVQVLSVQVPNYPPRGALIIVHQWIKLQLVKRTKTSFLPRPAFSIWEIADPTLYFAISYFRSLSLNNSTAQQVATKLYTHTVKDWNTLGLLHKQLTKNTLYSNTLARELVRVFSLTTLTFA